MKTPKINFCQFKGRLLKGGGIWDWSSRESSISKNRDGIYPEGNNIDKCLKMKNYKLEKSEIVYQLGLNPKKLVVIE